MHRNVCTFPSKSIAPVELKSTQFTLSATVDNECGHSRKRSRADVDTVVTVTDSGTSFDGNEDVFFPLMMLVMTMQ